MAILHRYMYELEVFREDIPREHFSKLNCLLPMHAHNYCDITQIKRLWYAVYIYYIGYLHSIKAGWVILLWVVLSKMKVYSCASACHTPRWLSATICFIG